jgi:hypothetical protein
MKRSIAMTPRGMVIGFAAALALAASAAALASAKSTDATLAFGQGGKLKITVTGVADPLTLGDDELASRGPAAGAKYVGVHLRLANVGRIPYEGWFYGDDWRLEDLARSPLRPVQVLNWGCEGASLNGTLHPGEVGFGCEAWQVPQHEVGFGFLLLATAKAYGSWDLQVFDPVRRRSVVGGPERRAMIRGADVQSIGASLPAGCYQYEATAATRFPNWGTVALVGVPPRCGASLSDVISVHKVHGHWVRHQYGNGGGCHMPRRVRRDLRLACY